MSDILLQLISDTISCLLLFLPGYIWARLLAPTSRTLVTLANTLLLSVTMVSIPVFTVCLLTRNFIDATWMASGAVIIGSIGLALLKHRQIALFTPATSSSFRTDRLALLFAGVTLIFFLVNYDRNHFQYGCINGVVMQALTPEAANAFDPHGDKDENAVESIDWGAPVADRNNSMNLLDVHGTGQRLGTTAIISPVVALFDVFGFRLIYTLLPVLCFLFGYRLILCLTNNGMAAILGSAIAVLNPYVSKIVILDENVMAFSFATAALAFLMESRRSSRDIQPHSRVAHYAVAGVAFGAALGIRHIDLPFALAALILIGRNPRGLLVFGITTIIAAAPCALHHHFTYGSVFQHEHFVDEVFQSFPHSIFGYDFQYTGLLNWPFYDSYVRTPYNPFPTVFYYPLNILAHLGTALTALALLGVGVMIRYHARLTAALTTWLIPQYGLLAVLENWMDPNKLGVIISLFPILLITLGLGIHALQSRAKVTTWIAVTAALTALSLGSDGIRFPDDPRFYEKYPRVRHERSEYYTFERSRLATGSPFPSSYFFQQYTRYDAVSRLSMLAEDWRDRRFRRPAAPIEDAGDLEIRLSLDFSRPLMGREQIATLGHTSGLPVIDARPAATQVQIQGLQGWEAQTPLEALIARNSTNELAIYLRYGEDGFADVSSDRVFSLEKRQRPELVNSAITGSVLNLRLRENDRVYVYETVCLDEVLVYVWELEFDGSNIIQHPPRKMFHN
jgi:hypothetical protein